MVQPAPMPHRRVTTTTNGNDNEPNTATTTTTKVWQGEMTTAEGAEPLVSFFSSLSVFFY
jgi:hypothetical protein